LNISVFGRLRAIAAAAFLFAATVSAAIVPAAAGPISQHAVDADVLIQAGKPDEALDAFERATEALWAAIPLHCRTATFAQTVTGFSQYEPRRDTRFRSGDAATVYLEPVGYRFMTDRETFRVALATRVEIRTADGLIMAMTDDFGDLGWEGQSPNRQVHASIATTLPDLKPGDYLLRVTLVDRASDESTNVTLPFAIVE